MTKAELLGAVDALIERWMEAREILASLRTALERDPVAEVTRELKASAGVEAGDAPRRPRGRPAGSGRAGKKREEMTALRGSIPAGPVVVSAAVAAQRRGTAEAPEAESRGGAGTTSGGAEGSAAYSLEALVRELSGSHGGAAQQER